MIVAITGASQGIGAAIAEAFAAEDGARLALMARTETKLEAVAEQCRALGAEATVFLCDVTDEDDVAAMAEGVLAQVGVPDVLVNNAGLFRPGGLLDLTPDDFRMQIDTNLTSAYLVTRAFLPAMLERERGDLFFMASVAAIRGYPGGAAYCAAKHGLLGLARATREETKGTGLRVTTLLPGATLTSSWDGTDLPPARFMPPEDIAHAVVDLHKLTGRTVVEEIILRPQQGDV